MKTENHLTIGALDVVHRGVGLDAEYGIIIYRGIHFHRLSGVISNISRLERSQLAAATGTGQLAALFVHADAHVVNLRAGAIGDNELTLTASIFDDDGRLPTVAVGQAHQLCFAA